MRAVKGVGICFVLLVLLSAGPSFGRDLQQMTDSELDGVHARGLTFLFDSSTLLNGGSISPYNINFNGTNNLSLRNSIMLSGNVQQSGLGVVNAVNSTVNMPINLIVLINSQISGGINLKNVLSGSNRLW
ncbi:MAG: hypothetical protein A4E57_00221 [Syntrophorhabdaceae bacterium PtaU1.Bin034]|nr:MAG: hypothetical protein A4E57_00221 [Syntrophorhabdaceae bacterium PtaU1.Bin034]